MTGVASGLLATIERTVEGLGYEFVDAERLAGGLLRVTLDHAQGVGLNDCERVSRQLSHLFAVENVEYQRLEVSSPGVDRPLRRARDFERFIGADVQVQLYGVLAAAGGRRRLQGRLLGVNGDRGAERLTIALRSEVPGTGPVAGGRPVKKSVKQVAKQKAKQSAAPEVSVEFALAEVEKAKLVPELNFRGRSKE